MSLKKRLQSFKEKFKSGKKVKQKNPEERFEIEKLSISETNVLSKSDIKEQDFEKKVFIQDDQANIARVSKDAGQDTDLAPASKDSIHDTDFAPVENTLITAEMSIKETIDTSSGDIFFAEDFKIEEIQNESKIQVGDEVSTVNQGEIISSKKVVYIEIDDEVTSVYDKIKNLRIRHVYLVIPQRAVVFQSIVNLKILKKKSEEIGQNLYVITNDKNGAYLCQQVGITVYDKAENEDRPAIFSSEDEDEKIRISPLKASVNSVVDETPTRLAEKKVSIPEILAAERNRKKFFGGMRGGNDFRNEKLSPVTFKPENKDESKKKPRLVLVAPNKQALIGLGVFSVFILLVIFYIALPGATLYLTPTASILEKSVNVTLADYEINKAEIEASTSHMIPSKKMAIRVERAIQYQSTGKKLSPNASNASGKLTIINNSDRDWGLVQKTRFQTNDGLVFRITNDVTVPASSTTGPGKLEAYVVADPVDAFGQVIGERGNIGPAKFFLPGLSESNRALLSAESTASMAGGITSFTPEVTEEDIEASKAKLSETLMKAVEDELKAEIVRQNETSKTDYILLTGINAIEVGKVVTNPILAQPGQELPQFEVSGYITASAYAYSKSEMNALLTQELTLKKSPQKKLVKINEDSISYQIFEKDSVRNKIKITANIKGIEEFDLDPEKENGARLISKIKEHILGKDIEDARNYIQNLPEINKVEIEMWPAWSPTIPTVADNIDIEIRDAISVD
ncbi:MAG TPA: hypothetical protein PK398_01530 [Candidatus Gracilibacteria bacterium]|nr:hypothetical protein [Candidatus Gracilibacteria bacterium]